MLAMASISNFSTQYSKFSIVYSYLSKLNVGFKGISINSPFWLVYFTISVCNTNSGLALVTFII